MKLALCRKAEPCGARTLVLAAAFVLCACAGSRSEGPVESALAAGDHELTLAHGGRNRAYIVHVPPRLAASTPVVLAFHGGGGEAAGFQGYAGLDLVADREGFVVVYPYGSGVLPRRLLTWNAGDCCGFAMNQQIDDVGFAVALLDDLGARVPVDPTRVYATGHSNGSMMAYRLAAERSDRFAAVAPVAGAMSVDGPSARAVAVLHIHSVDDPRALYEGGLGPPFPGTDVRSEHRPVESSLAAWVRQNGCTGEPRVVETRTGAPRTVNEGQTATLLTWDRCSSGRPVAHWKLTGVGHSWPGNDVSELREELIGAPTTLISAAEEAWRFFAPLRR